MENNTQIPGARLPDPQNFPFFMPESRIIRRQLGSLVLVNRQEFIEKLHFAVIKYYSLQLILVAYFYLIDYIVLYKWRMDGAKRKIISEV
jgi:hypothetical protein